MLKSKRFNTAATIILTVLVIITLLPLALIVISSFTKESALIRNGYSFWPQEWSLDAYYYMIKQGAVILRSYGISVFVTVVGTAASVILTTMLAYPMSRKSFKYHHALSFFVFFTMLFNGGLVPGYMMWTQMFHIKNTIFALIVPGLLLNAFNVIMMRTYFTTNIPEEVLEAARIDGGGELYILTKVVLPMSKPIIVTLLLLIGLSYWNDWLNGLYYVNRDNLYSIQVLLKKMMDDIEMIKKASAAGASTMKMPSISIRMAVAVMGALPIMCVYPFFQKYFVKGIVIGAVKG